jgi:predicted ATPase
MDRITIQDVRCFDGINHARLAPLTVLVGENSTGKSTFLALVRLAWGLAQGVGDKEPDFNEEPFELGSYDQIASLRVGRPGLAKSFTIGADFLERGRTAENLSLRGIFTALRGQPALREWSLEASPYRIRFVRVDEGANITITSPSGTLEIVSTVRGIGGVSLMGYFVRLAASRVALAQPAEGRELPLAIRAQGSISAEDVGTIDVILHDLQTIGPRPFAFAPIRSRPRRTYDPVKDVEQPEGSHVPMVLARLYTEDRKGSEGLRAAIEQFGKESGLFSDVTVRRKGRKESDPFQVLVRIEDSAAFNLTDVGYGVSQVLPIVVDCLRQEPGSRFLLQQPEVHLHPKAQAALGTFLGTLAKEQRKQFVIETHSDYLLDRIRVDVRERRHLASKDVMVLYFERQGDSVSIHEIGLDDSGNLVGAPPSYRTFFLNEERKILGG